MQILSYPIAIYSEKNKQLINTLFFFRHVINFYLRQFFEKSSLTTLSRNKYAYKCLEKRAVQKRYYIPSRINRGLLEIAGRILRTIEDRRELYSLLKSFSLDPKEWSSLLLKEKDIYRKSQYIENLKEQALNFLEENDELKDDYLDLVNPPRTRFGVCSYAPDDGQSIKLEEARYRNTGQQVEKDTLIVSLKVLKEDRNQSIFRSDWEWISFSLILPNVLSSDNLLAKPSL